MKHRSPTFRLGSFLTLSLVAVLIISACASVVTSPPEATPVSSTAAPSDTTSDTAAAATPAQADQVQAVATSRGPNLEATDPSTVSLASGQLQLIEFFRFT
jgi:hypothetical protein